MATSLRYQIQEEKQTEKFTVKIHKETLALFKKYLEFLRSDCGLKIDEEIVLNDIIEFGVKKFDKSADWKAKITAKNGATKSKTAV